jgi:hypothetical protein
MRHAIRWMLPLALATIGVLATDLPVLQKAATALTVQSSPDHVVKLYHEQDFGHHANAIFAWRGRA